MRKRAIDVVLGGNVSGRPQAGGHRWALRQWVLGLAALGLRVAFTEQAPTPHDPQPGAVLNIMGFLSARGRDQHVPWAFVDIDPGYPQMWRELGLADPCAGHDRFVTLGENIGRHDCLIPTAGLPWLTTPPPVSLSEWPVTAPGQAFTTVATWRNAYGPVSYRNRTYGSRVHEFRKFIALPKLVDASFELALDIDRAETDDLRALDQAGWRLIDPATVAATPAAYRRYIQRSRAEFCVAQNMYVATRGGWLSDRSLCFLASGKPVLAQDTGFTRNYPVGDGLVAFSTLDQAAAGVEEINRNYAHHSDAARELAAEYFDAPKVMARLLERLGLREHLDIRMPVAA